MAIRKINTPTVPPLVSPKPADSPASRSVSQEVTRSSSPSDAAALRGLTGARAGRIGSGILGGLIQSVAPLTVAGVTDTADGLINRVLEHAGDDKSLLPLLEEALR